MQYIFLRGIIENTLINFVCPQCQNKSDEQNLFLTGITSQGVDINIHCPSCHANTLLHAEINTMTNELMSSEHGKEFIKEFLEKWWKIWAQIPHQATMQNMNNSIKDEDITALYKNLKNAHTVEDIMGNIE
jgi:hypothetical protein